MKITLLKGSRFGEPLIWVAEIGEHGLHVQYGRRGRGLRSQTYPRMTCVDQDPETELDGLVKEMKDDGYVSEEEFNSLRSSECQNSATGIDLDAFEFQADDHVWF